MRNVSHNPTRVRPAGSLTPRRGGVQQAATGRRGPAAFTLVELMIVVVILGILATIVIPQFSNASYSAREATLKDDLRFLRVQVQVFKAQHLDVAPGYPGGDRSAAPSENDFVAQMTLHSDERCNTNAVATSVFRFGPYLTRVPVNPITDQSTVYVVPNGQPLPAAGALPVMNGGVPYGWIYKPHTEQWMANIAGNDSAGTPFANY